MAGAPDRMMPKASRAGVARWTWSVAAVMEVAFVVIAALKLHEG